MAGTCSSLLPFNFFKPSLLIILLRPIFDNLFDGFMEKTLDEELWDTKDAIRIAKGNPDKTGALRRETLRHLIELTHSRHPSLKILAAGGIRHFFKYFPDLEEEAINAVYDLCEDHDSEVRKGGYSAITQVSKERPKWVKRNADVLVQLLQSDEPDEVVVVKKALVEHLNMDPCVTLGVLCDQIVPPEEPGDEEESFVRDRLRSLVLSFLTREAKRAIVEQDVGRPDSGAEDVLINALLAAIPKLNNTDIEIIVKDLLVSLPSYKVSNSSRGSDLLQLLLDKAKASFRNDFHPGDHASFKKTRLFLNLAKYIVLKEKIASSTNLLQFFCASLIGKMTLQKIPPEDQVLVIVDTAEILTACDEEFRNRSSKQHLFLQRQVTDACPILLEGLSDSRTSHIKSWGTCKVLLQACLRRKQESNWIVPTHLLNLLRKIKALPESAGEEENFQEVQVLIRSLVQHTIKPVSQPSAGTLDVSPGLSGSSESTNILTEQLHSKPSAGGPPLETATVATQLRRQPDETKPVLKILGAHSTANSTTSSKRPRVVDNSPRLPKKLKQGDTNLGPSLLSRMGSSIASEPTTRATSISFQEQGARSRLPENEGISPGGYSIRGAAKAERRLEPNTLSTSSLLDRMKDLSTGDDDSVRKRKKRGKGHR